MLDQSRIHFRQVKANKIPKPHGYRVWLCCLAVGMVSLFCTAVLAKEPTTAFAKWEREVAAIEARQRAARIESGGVVFAGSSSVRMWNLEQAFSGKGYVNSGFGGSQIRDCTHFAGRLVLPHRPNMVVFYAGDNDINNARTPEQVRDDFAAFAATIHRDLPTCRIAFIAIKPSIARWKQRERQARANELIAELCRNDARLSFVDIAAPMLGDDGQPRRELFVKDGLHLSAAGYALWQPLVEKAIAGHK